jgi:hypothetical protein
MPAFAVPAAISAVQLGVSVTNLIRVAREVERRKERPEFAALLEKDHHLLRDITIGVVVRATLCGVTVGIVGGGEIVNAFHDFAVEHALDHTVAGLCESLTTQHLTDCLGAALTSHAAVLTHPGAVGFHHPGDPFDKDVFEAAHPQLFKADNVLHQTLARI